MSYVYTKEGETCVNMEETTSLGEDIEYTKEDLLCMLHDIEQYDNNGDILSQEDVISMMVDVDSLGK